MQRKPDWLKIKLEGGENYAEVKKIVETNHLHTICSSGKCPNMCKCWNMGTATFMILGDICTRACKFCATATGKPLPPDVSEQQKVSESIAIMKLKHCVITSVDRDDLADKGATFWANTILAVKKRNPQTIVEVLTPDFDNIDANLQIVFASKPDIFGHNVETVKRLSSQIRSRAKYENSLDVIAKAGAVGLITKSGLMVGLGETEDEVLQTLHDLRSVGCNMVTIGQYLQPTRQNIEVQQYITPQQFENFKQSALAMGFDSVESAPLVRSSFMAERSFIHSKIQKK
ncbi:MAG: lipoyl synthase [Bacteroidales bacterium]|jgi:lipoic acid synthetase|nr:lipoyl synthase [Bacteroidales bacterium]